MRVVAIGAFGQGIMVAALMTLAARRNVAGTGWPVTAVAVETIHLLFVGSTGVGDLL